MSHSTVADYFSSEQDFVQPISARSDIRLLITETFFFSNQRKSLLRKPNKKSFEKFEKFAKAKRGKREMSNYHESSVSHRIKRLTPLGIWWFKL